MRRDNWSPLVWFACLIVAMIPGGRVADVRAAVPQGIHIYETREAPPPLRDLSNPGDNLSRLDLDGKVVAVNFWATWCAPCKAEMPSMDKLYRELRNQGLVFLAIAVGDSERSVLNFQRRARDPVSFPLITDESKQIAQDWSVSSVPITYVLDRRGRIAIRVAGEMDWLSPRIVNPIRDLLDEATAESSK